MIKKFSLYGLKYEVPEHLKFIPGTKLKVENIFRIFEGRGGQDGHQDGSCPPIKPDVLK